ncbi:hypothetical protein CK203_107540 [Vitis vinifera]|uniref:Uncharacterized protein n=1 Tax=Vitis vinifera TaxID=29760 RepID=A0A438CWU2_VITVI|nr:hypothetical protein CK203_107540 [Vitis vinifera]
MFGSILEESGTLLSIGVRSLKTCIARASRPLSVEILRDFTIGALGMRGSACVEVMTTLHGSAPSLRRRAEGCVPMEDPSSRTPSLHVGASEGLQSLFSYSSDLVFPLFSLQLRVLGDCHLAVDTFMTPEFSSYIQISDCHLKTMCFQFRSRLSLESHSGGEFEDD